MAVNTVLSRLAGSPLLGYEWWQSFLGDGSTATTATITGSKVDADGAVAVSAHLANTTWTDGTFTMTLQGSNDNSVWFTLATATAIGSANQSVSCGVVEGGSQTSGTVAVAVNIPRYVRAVVTVTGAPATGSVLTYVYLKVLHFGITGGA